MGTSAFIVEVSAGEALARQWARAAAGTKGVATVSRVGPVASTLRALRAAVRFRELLTVFFTLAPAAGFAFDMATRAVALWSREVIDVDV